MMLSVKTRKLRKKDCTPVYKTYRYPAFNTSVEGYNWQEKFNNAFQKLKEQINEDRKHNDMNLYEPIVIVDVWLS